MDWFIYVLLRLVIIVVIVSMNYVFTVLISNLRTISSSNAHYIYRKEKRLCRKFVVLRFQFSIEMKTAFFYTLLFGSVKLNDIKDTHREKVPSNKALSVKTKANPNFAVKLAERSNHSFLLYIWWITFFKHLCS